MEVEVGVRGWRSEVEVRGCGQRLRSEVKVVGLGRRSRLEGVKRG